MNAVEVGAYKATIPGPGVFSIGGRVNTYIPTAGPNIPFKCCLLAVIEYLAGSKQEDNSIIVCQVCIVKNRRVFREIDRKVMFSSQLLQRYFAILDGGMAESACLGKDEQPTMAYIGRRGTIDMSCGCCRSLHRAAAHDRQQCERKYRCEH